VKKGESHIRRIVFGVKNFRVQKNPFLKQAQPLVFWVLLGFGLYRVFGFFYLNEELGSLLVDLAHQLSFYLVSPVL